MNNQAKKQQTIGILGGMGPEATVYLFNKIIRLTQARRDQDHIHTIIDANPKTPDRTEHIISGAASPLPYLIKGAQNLESAGADFILMPCVTAHYFYEQILEHIHIPIVNLLTQTLEIILRHPIRPRKIGIIATKGTIGTGMFQDLLKSAGLEPLTPDAAGQALFNEAIYGSEGVKAGFKEKPKRLLRELAGILQAKGADGILAGCTEVPLALGREDIDIPFFEPMEIIAKEGIKQAGYQLKKD